MPAIAPGQETDVNWIAEYFGKQCEQSIKTTASLVWKKLTSPKDTFTFKFSSKVIEDMANNLDDLAGNDMAEDYAYQAATVYGTGLLAIASEELGLDKLIASALNTIFRLMSMIQMLNNTFVFILLKFAAENCNKQIVKKRKLLNELRSNLVELHNLVLIFTGNDPAFDKYVASLREAWSLLLGARDDLRQVKDGIELAKVFRLASFNTAKTKVDKAQKIFNPGRRQNDPFLGPVMNPDNKGLSGGRIAAHNLLTATTGIPSNDQINAFLKMGKRIRDISSNMEMYAVNVVAINTLLTAIQLGPNALTTAMSDFMLNTAGDVVDTVIGELNVMVGNTDAARGTVQKGEMPEVLRLVPPEPGQRASPEPVTVSVMALKWTAQLSLIISQMKMVPLEGLAKASLASEDVIYFESVLAQLAALDTITTTTATLVATDAQESPGAFESQMLLMLLGAMHIIPQSGPADREKQKTENWAALVKAMIARVDLTLQRDSQIESILNGFIQHPFQQEAELRKMLKQLKDFMAKLGLDRALDLFTAGKFTEFFKLKGKNAMFAGAAMSAIALLKSCFDNEKEANELNKIQRKLERNMDLLNIKVSFDIDLAIKNSLNDCKLAIDFSFILKLKSYICGLIQQSVKSPFSSVKDKTTYSLFTKVKDNTGTGASIAGVPG